MVDAFKKSVLIGRHRPGDLLPSVRRIAADLAINPNTVVRAYQILEVRGVIAGRKGKGFFLTEQAPGLCRREAGGAGLAELEELVLRLRAQSVGDAEIMMSVKRALRKADAAAGRHERHIG